MSSQKGISIVEVVIYLGLTITGFWGFLELSRYSLRVQEEAGSKIESLYLANEALEAVRSIKDEDWDKIGYGERHLMIASNKWEIGPGRSGFLINGKYERWIDIGGVHRDGSGNIVFEPNMPSDPQSRSVVAIVEWTERGKTKQTILATYITNWREE